jgi:hypothetical protein
MPVNTNFSWAHHIAKLDELHKNAVRYNHLGASYAILQDDRGRFFIQVNKICGGGTFTLATLSTFQTKVYENLDDAIDDAIGLFK